MLNIITLKAFSDNYIWLIKGDEVNHCVVVDPGDAQPVIDALVDHSLNLSSILITHHHPDHVGGIAKLKEYSNATVYGPARENIPHLNVSLSEGDIVRIPELSLEFSILEIPGHTKGHIAYYYKKVLFCGDTLFAGGCGRLFEGTAEQMHKSLSKIAKLPDDTKIYCAHEYTESNLEFARYVDPDNKKLSGRIQEVKKLRLNKHPTVPSLLAEEKATNPFLRCHNKSLQAMAAQQLGRAVTSEVETFATIRSLKDSF